MGYMCSGSIVGYTTLFCDLAVIQALTDQLCNLELPWRYVKTILDIVPLSWAKHNAIIIVDSAQKSVFLLRIF